jgi:4-hydroxybenzoate polyprenyltransferase
LLFIGLLQTLTHHLHPPTPANYTHLGLVLLSTLLIAAAANLLNDYYDQKIDQINHPSRVFVGKLLHASTIFRISWLLNLLGLALPLLWGAYMLLWVNILVVLGLYLYNRWLKALPLLGNLSIALACGVSIWVVYASAEQPCPPSVWIFIGLVGLTTFLRELVKDIEDIEGDKAQSALTFPVVFGIFVSKIIAAGLGWILVIILSFLLGRNPMNPDKLLILLAWAGSVWVFIQICTANTRKDFARLSRDLKIYALICTSWLFTMGS